MPSWELFESQSAAYRAAVLGPGTARVACEAAMRFGWDRYLGERGSFIGMTGFGASGSADRLFEHFGITATAIVSEARRLLDQRR
jgi:transketolase